MSHVANYLDQVAVIAGNLPSLEIEKLVEELVHLRAEKGTLYIVGLGGSAANASHMAADFRKLCQIDARSLDNVAEITARANDEGWSTIFDGFLTDLCEYDAVFILSVGGGTDKVSVPLIDVLSKARFVRAKIFGITGPDGGYTRQHADICIRIPCKTNTTPHTEAFQAVLWHCLVSHPKLQRVKTKW